MQPLLEATGLKAGRDFFLAFSPERVDPGNPTFQTHNVPKVVGGLTPACVQLASALYGSAITTIVPVSSTRVAEMVKLLENTFRAVNIGLVNELALMCDRMEIDVWEVVDAAKTKPFGFMAFYPGPGLGGHCIPIDPFYLSWKAKQSGFDPRFIELAGHINGGMPHYVVDKVAEALNTKRKAINGSKVLIAGVAYKRDIDDMRESPALDVMGLLHARGAEVSYVDPHVPEVHGREWSGRFDIKAVDAGRGSFGQYDCVVVITDHKAFDYDAMVAEADLIVDTRNAIKTPARNVFKLGAPRPEGETVAHASQDPRLRVPFTGPGRETAPSPSRSSPGSPAADGRRRAGAAPRSARASAQRSTVAGSTAVSRRPWKIWIGRSRRALNAS